MREALRLVIPSGLMARLRSAAAAAYPEEMCALLVGRRRAAGVTEVTRLVPAANVHPEPRRSFEVDPRVLVGLLRELREAGAGEGGEGLLGHAHSHPDSPARPSERDRALAFEPGLIWLIVPVRDGRAGIARAWRATADSMGEAGFRPVRIAAAAGPGRARRARRPVQKALDRAPGAGHR